MTTLFYYVLDSVHLASLPLEWSPLTFGLKVIAPVLKKLFNGGLVIIKKKKKKKVHTFYRSCCVNKNFNLNNIRLGIKR